MECRSLIPSRGYARKFNIEQSDLLSVSNPDGEIVFMDLQGEYEK